jgi:GT2 family glycosyltransferase
MLERQPSTTPETAGREEYLVSAVVVSWNTRALLRECVASTLADAADLGGRVEIIVVDNASSDGSVEMVRSEFPTVRVIANESNNGFASATNQGLRASRGTHLMLLNPDTRVMRGSLRAMVSFLESHPRVGSVGPRLVGAQGEHQVSCFPLPTLAKELWRLYHLDRLYVLASYPLSRFSDGLPQQVESIQGACMLLRREALEQTGLLDERFFIYTEEIDLCRRLVDAGWDIFFVPAAVVVHFGGASTAQVSARMFLELYRSKVQYFRKHLGDRGALAYKGVLLAATLPRLMMSALTVAFVPSRREKSRGLLKSYSSLLAQLPAL